VPNLPPGLVILPLLQCSVVLRTQVFEELLSLVTTELDLLDSVAGEF
jgi:hypothetical protein